MKGIYHPTGIGRQPLRLLIYSDEDSFLRRFSYSHKIQTFTAVIAKNAYRNSNAHNRSIVLFNSLILLDLEPVGTN